MMMMNCIFADAIGLIAVMTWCLVLAQTYASEATVSYKE